MRVNPAYISIGTNRSSSCSACTSNGLLAFGAGKLVALWDTESSQGVCETLPGHKGQITTLKLLGNDQFISGDTVGEIRVWGQKDDKWICEQKWSAHEGSSISAIGTGKDLVLTGGSDGSIKVWKWNKGKGEVGMSLEEIQKIQIKGKLPLDIELTYLPGSNSPILAVGATDRLIRIYTLSPAGNFVHSLSLEGHEDWVRCLSFTSYPSSSDATKEDLLLASGSHDNFVRLWRVSQIEAQEPREEKSSEEGLDLLDEFERRLNGEGSGQISTKAHVMAVQDGDQSLRYNITLEALLIGHESSLTNIHWSPPSTTSSPLLLSTAADNSLIMWVPSSLSTSTDGIWVPEHRFGAIGGRGLAFYGAIWGKDGESVMAGGWNGGWERWVKSDEGWEVRSGVNGHYGDVQSIAWDPRGEYLISVGSDQTSRIHAESSIPSSSTSRWAEIARPQIHGYDMTDIAFISPLRFVSGADEKVARVFDAPEGFVESLRTLGVSEGSRNEEGSRPKGATVPPLGLSNRALQKAPAAEEAIEKHGQNEAIISISHTLTSLPTEEELATSTLWPEIEKIYGHGYELVCVASSQSGDLIATASKATNAEYAGIRVISTKNWEIFGDVLNGHSLTVTRIVFSQDDQFILTCSRDRGWRIFETSDKGYTLLAKDEKAHSRMVLDATWAKTEENGKSCLFATASRDKTVKIWIPSEEDRSQWIAADTIKFTEATTAVDIISYQDSYLLAVGTETGSISIHSLKQVEDKVESKELISLESSISHVAPVNRLAWRWKGDRVQLASCSDDRSVRVFDVEV
ncbi:uncharacterized protein IL334_004312 [Kwoniella shivajii]|uniref:Elongator complex protein 2 n=1 Tax=Kwoniella shivajii TaxID=564305 RepID=A0ABZ1CZZ3_9TREE|nr:hypothetical protein IL334_004312 [Kwoniella shivajii]